MAYATGGLAIVALVLLVAGMAAQSGSSRLIRSQRGLIEALQTQIQAQGGLIEAQRKQIALKDELIDLLRARRVLPSAEVMRVPPSH